LHKSNSKRDAKLKYPGYLEKHGMPDLTVFSRIRFFTIPFPEGWIIGEREREVVQGCNIFS
jgi:hypothetical protein